MLNFLGFAKKETKKENKAYRHIFFHPFDIKIILFSILTTYI